MEANKIELKILVLSLLAILSTEAAMQIAISKDPLIRLAILGAARIVEIILIVLIVLFRGKGLDSIGLARSNFVFGLKRGLIWSAGFGLVTLLAIGGSRVAGINTLPLIQVRLPTGGTTAPFFLIGGIVGPVAEEVFFRGVLYGFFRRWGVVVALLLSTLFFVLLHPINHGVPVPQLAGGMVFALAYELEGSLVVPITIHTLGNIAIFFLSLLT